MPIQALPAATAHLLSSAQLLLTPASAVKELIDNALDAGATSVAVEISADTVTAIQIRDNGHGIPPKDRFLFGHRGCTSKIRNEADLRTVGGSSLGFRGEAVSALSGGSPRKGVCRIVRVTTRIAGEDVGRSWDVGTWTPTHTGQAVSFPVGTTMRLTDFFATLPVRKQEALKTAGKCLADIKRMLKAYAFARPVVRFSLEVLKAKSPTVNWTFAPCKSPNEKPEYIAQLIEDAAIKITGRSCASQCQYHALEKDGYHVRALLPRHDAKTTGINGPGRFLQIDGRPVRATQAVLNKIVTLWKQGMKRAGLDGVYKDGFMWLDLACPEGAYDVNVEPAKDDVTFVNEHAILKVIEDLMISVYPKQEEAYVPQPLDELISSLEAPDAPVEVLVPRNPTAVPESTLPQRASAWASNMYSRDDDGDENVDTGGQSKIVAIPDEDLDDGETEEAVRSVEVSNPWTLAKMATKTKSIQNEPARLITPVKTPLKERPVNMINFDTSTESAPRTHQARFSFHTPQTGLDTPSATLPRRSGQLAHARDAARRFEPFARPSPSPRIDEEVDLYMSRQQRLSSEARLDTTRTPLPVSTSAHHTFQGTPLSSIPNISKHPRAQRQPRKFPPKFDRRQYEPQNTDEDPDILSVRLFDPEPTVSCNPPPKRRIQQKLKPPAFTHDLVTFTPINLSKHPQSNQDPIGAPVLTAQPTTHPLAPPARPSASFPQPATESEITQFFSSPAPRLIAGLTEAARRPASPSPVPAQATSVNAAAVAERCRPSRRCKHTRSQNPLPRASKVHAVRIRVCTTTEEIRTLRRVVGAGTERGVLDGGLSGVTEGEVEVWTEKIVGMLVRMNGGGGVDGELLRQGLERALGAREGLEGVELLV